MRKLEGAVLIADICSFASAVAFLALCSGRGHLAVRMYSIRSLECKHIGVVLVTQTVGSTIMRSSACMLDMC